MPARTKPEPSEYWRRRLYVPFYKVGEAARYARTSAQTAGRWHGYVLPARQERAELSYMQLIELAVVAAMRKVGVKLGKIRDTREYLATQFACEFPFAEFRFKTDGKELMISYDQVEPGSGVEKLVVTSQNGQLAWKEILDQVLREFEYDDGGVVVRWRVGGPHSSILIDPRISFGAPTVSGAATWAIKGRWEAGESIGDIAEDFSVARKDVEDALKFEGLTPHYDRQDLWLN